MFVDDLNVNDLVVRLSKVDIERILANGEIGLYQTIVMHRFTSSINGKYIEDCSEEEINIFVKRNIDFLKRKYKRVCFNIEFREIDESFLHLLDIIPNELPILIELRDFDIPDINLMDRINQKIGDKKVYFRDNMKEHNSPALWCLANIASTNKLVRFGWSNEKSKEVFMFDDIVRDGSVDLTIKNASDISDVVQKLKRFKLLLQSKLLKKVVVNIEIVDVGLFKRLGRYIGQLEEEDEWFLDKIEYNLNIDKIDGQFVPNESFFVPYSYISRPVRINAHGMQYNNFAEYGNFQSYVNFVLSKIPDTATELEKVVYVSKFIVENFKYDYANYKSELAGEGDIPDRNIAQFALGGIGVCRDYASLTEYLLNRVGVRCEYIGSNSYAYIEDRMIPGKIKRGKNGRIIDRKYRGHAFNIVYIDNQPYYVDNTWLSKGQRIYNSPYMLVSTETFLRTHSKYVEVEKHNCPTDYDRNAILDAEIWVERYWLTYTEKEISYLYQMGFNKVANNIDSSSVPKF